MKKCFFILNLFNTKTYEDADFCFELKISDNQKVVVVGNEDEQLKVTSEWIYNYHREVDFSEFENCMSEGVLLIDPHRFTYSKIFEIRILVS